MGCNCRCGVYKSGLLVAAQILSVIAFLLTFVGWWLSWICALTGMILVLCGACCRLNQGGFITAGVFAVLAAVGQLIFAVRVDRHGDLYCDENDDVYEESCQTATNVLSGMAYFSVALWISVAVMIFIVTAKLNDIPLLGDAKPYEARTTNHQQGTTADVEQQLTVTESITVLPDGKRKTEIITEHPDGSKTIETTIEEMETPSTNKEEDVQMAQATVLYS